MQSPEATLRTEQDPPSLDPSLWQGCYNGKESSLQQLAPYIGKIKSAMARVLIREFSEPGETVLDPFCGSGVVPLECALLGRRAWANDLSPYAYVLTRGKLEAPKSLETALDQAKSVIQRTEEKAPNIDVSSAPDWVQAFFHPITLAEVLVAFRVLREGEDFFGMSCLLGILHHQRPGFLSYPASHLVPYLRTEKYPSSEYPEMYEYRDLRSRLIAKVRRAYRRPKLPGNWDKRDYDVWMANAMQLPMDSGTVDSIVSSPPYFGALDYARDNRLRLWFLGCEDWRQLDESLTARRETYSDEMAVCLQEMHRVLKSRGRCVLVLGDVRRPGRTERTADLLASMAVAATDEGFSVDGVYEDRIPDARRSRRATRKTQVERILVMTKR